jgi:hypothetical protein
MSTEQITLPVPGAALALAQQLPAMPEDEVLDFTQKVRRGVIKDLLKNGMVPGDNSDRSLLTSMLDGLDRQAVGIKRIKAEEKAASGMSEASALAAQLLKEAGRTRIGGDDVVDVPVREVPTLGDDVPRPQLVPGETDISPRQSNYEEFAANRPQAPPVAAGDV